MGALALVGGLKLGSDRPRPVFVDPPAQEGTPSFPSGHATASLAVRGALCFLVVRSTVRSEWKLASVVLAGILVAAIGFSRLYLDVGANSVCAVNP